LAFRFSATSVTNLTTRTHPDLQRLFNEVIKHVDCMVLGGIRTLEQQEKDVASGKSETLASKHLPQSDGLAHAVDVCPFPPNWDDTQWKIDLWYFGGYVLATAQQMGIGIRWGGDWKRDNDPENNGFEDLDHFELASVL
jgi:peptidoglycan L-alanyl-D-glutamate endopeptidase CwlK